MNKNLDRRIHPIAEADGLSPKKLVNINAPPLTLDWIISLQWLLTKDVLSLAENISNHIINTLTRHSLTCSPSRISKA